MQIGIELGYWDKLYALGYNNVPFAINLHFKQL